MEVNVLSQVSIFINEKSYTVDSNMSVLDACKSVDVYIPTLCHHPLLEDVGACRVCAIEVEGSRTLMTACTTKVSDGMKVKTSSDRVEHALKENLSLLLSRHPNECMTCDVNGRCEFQNLINRYDIKDVYPKELRNVEFDTSSNAIFRDLNKCINCGRCVRVCQDVQGLSIYTVSNRGSESLPVPAFGFEMKYTDCIGCGQCSSVCPVGAITEQPDYKKVETNLRKHDKVLIVQTAPATRVAIGEEFDMAPGHVSTGKMVSALRRLGFDYVFDTNFAADLTIMEEGNELIGQLLGHGEHPAPMFTSCCPGWINLVEKHFPEFIPNVSTAKSPQEMLASTVKTYFAQKINVDPKDIYLVSVMPCTAKKDEVVRPQQFYNEFQMIDAVITTRELAKLIKNHKINFLDLPDEEYDAPLGLSTGAAAIFGVTGGVMEAALRTGYELATGKTLPKIEFKEVRGFTGVKDAEIDLDGKKVRIAVAHGTGNVIKLLNKIKSGESKYDFVEIMACYGGCIGGGGQPKSTDPEILKKRSEAIYSIDEASVLRKSHENPAIKELYAEFYGKPLSDLSKKLLHTHYTNRKKSILERAEEAAKV
jgi:NADH-quinone oxidoreductase subunit G